MDAKIKDFIQTQHCATLCYIGEHEKPYCFNCYYYFDAQLAILCFKSSALSKHSNLMKEGSAVAGTILSGSNNDQKLLREGVQLEGEVLTVPDSLKHLLSEQYYAIYPIAKKISGAIWYIKLNTIIMSNSSEVFGEKLYWNRD